MSFNEDQNGLDGIAIIGMQGRFPGAKDTHEFWQLLKDGKETVRFFSDEELRAIELDFDAVKDKPNYVRARGVLEDVDQFDASFFGFNPKEATVLDPQQRVWLECAWEALERAGYDPEKYNGSIGVYAGSYVNSYLLYNLCSDRDYIERLVRLRSVDAYQNIVSNDKDFLPSRTSYKFNLCGPSVNIQTACSTSLVAICQACQSLLNYESDLCLAGGICISFPQIRGYLSHEGGILSLDGHCRPFDAGAQGTVLSSGVGVVVLKRLEDAWAAGDSILAVIKGFALNNDGSKKVSYTAPSVEGQAEVIAMAHAMAGVDPESISYVEAHGTATPLGDPIEIAGLTKAFRLKTDAKQFCGIGSVKSNIGHLDSAAGVAGLIKTVLALQHKQIPPSLHYERPNPEIDFDNSPFYVIKELTEWTNSETPRRAGVSSFGVGGTNAHVILEEPPLQSDTTDSRPLHLLSLSAKTETALDLATQNLANHLKEHRALDLGDVAYTLHVGRKDMRHRRTIVCENLDDAIDALQSRDAKRVSTRIVESSEPRVAFMFPGQGAQYVNMGRQLYETEPTFTLHLDTCSEILAPQLGVDIRHILFPESGNIAQAAEQLKSTVITQPAIFAISYALARLWMNYGIKPHAMIGHSVGEYVAACLAGVFKLEDALFILAERARLMQEQPEGSMLAVRLSEPEIRSYLTEDIDLAAVNSPSLSVIAGETKAIEAFGKLLESKGVHSRKLHTSHAYHSKMMESMVGIFERAFRNIECQKPQIPIVSSQTGKWLSNQEAVDSKYWAQQVRNPVLFSKGVLTLQDKFDGILLEVGPGNTLSTLAQQHPQKERTHVAVSSLGHPEKKQPALYTFLRAMGQIWISGVPVDWEAFYAHERRQRLVLPTYPFEKKRYWIDPPPLVKNQLSPLELPVESLTSAQPNGSEPSTRSDASRPQMLQDMENQQNTNGISRRKAILDRLKAVFYDLSGIEFTDAIITTSFMEMGLDSLFLTQVSAELENQLGVKIRFRQLLEDVDSLDALTNYYDEKLPPDHFKEAIQISEGNTTGLSESGMNASPSPVTPTEPISNSTTAANSDSHLIERVVQQQLQAMSQLMAQQLNALQSGATGLPSILPTDSSLIQPGAVSLDQANKPDDAPALPNAPVATKTASSGKERFGPYNPIERAKGGGLTPGQQEYLDKFIERFTKRTKESKRIAQTYRSVQADPRSVNGFRLLWKELVYQIVSARSSGSKIWDVDGNEYVDITMCFGANLLGHSPAFITDAIKEQLEKGVEIGPQSQLAGRVAEQIREFTGLDRVSFCNTGSEAVMAALRMARTVTGRTKFVSFSGDYHGVFDDVLARGQAIRGKLHTFPAAPGIPRETVANNLVLPYGADESLQFLENHINEIAAVLVEPIQSRHPDVRPQGFLEKIREITAKAGTGLIFDEVITGFRVHPGGAQAFYDVKPDIAAYGKIIGGGLPIGVVAGVTQYMDTLDGGMWQYGDESVPESDVTFFAGTFVRHPLALAAGNAVLKYLKEQGPALQEQLNTKTTEFARNLNDFFEQRHVPIRIRHFSSWFRFDYPPDLTYAQILFYRMLEKGVYIREAAQNCFFSTAHSEEDISFITQTIQECVLELQDEGFLPQRMDLKVPKESIISPSSINSVRAAPGDRFPLTEAQTEIWLASQMGDDASAAFNQPFCLRLKGPFDVDRFREALRQVLARHEAFSLRFYTSEAYQAVTNPGKLKIPLLDLSSFDETEKLLRVKEAFSRASSKPFSLDKAPLLQVQILRLKENEHMIVFAQHHLICDGWSSGVLVDEISNIYTALCTGTLSELQEPMQFSEYVRSHLEERDGLKISTAYAFWVDKFAELSPALNLPTDRQRPSIKTYSGKTVRWTFDSEVYDAAKQMAVRQKVSLFVLMLAAFKVLLARISMQNDIVVGIPIAGQATVGKKPLIGHCVNFLPLRSNLEFTDRFEEFLKAIKSSMLDTLEHQQCTLGGILQQLKIPRDPSRLPLVEVQFNLDRGKTRKRFKNLEASVEKIPVQSVIFDLFFDVSEIDNNLIVNCDYNTDLFEEETIQRWIGHYETILQSVQRNVNQRIGDISLLSHQQSDQLLTFWNATSRTYPAETVDRLFEAQASRTPDAAAVLGAGTPLSYRQLSERSNQLAHHLRQAGVKAGACVGLCMERTPEMVVGLLGILKAGAAYVPLDPSYPRSRLAYMVDEAGVETIVTEAPLLELLPTRQMVCLDRDWAQIQSQPSDPLPEGAEPQNLAYVIFTSGSTGRPKGVQIPHRALVNFLCSMQHEPGLKTEDVLLSVTTLSFDIAALEIYLPLITGASVVIATREEVSDGRLLAQALDSRGVSVMQATPATWRLLLESGWAGREDLKMLCGGEALSLDLAQALLSKGGELWNMYGPTETTIWSSISRIDPSDALITIGRPIANTQFYVLDGHMNPVPIGVVGRLFIGGDGLAQGYLNRAALTAEKFVVNPFGAGTIYDTGDLARYLPDGRVVCLGRRDQQVKLRGHRIELGEIESVLEELESVVQAAVVVREDEPGDRRLVGYVVGDVSVESLRGHVRTELPGYMAPSVFKVLDAMPLTPNGKIDRNALPSPGANRPDLRQPYRAPQNEVESQLVFIWEQVLNVEPVGVDDNFFDLGGHSFLALTVIDRVEQIFEERIPVASLFQAPTIQKLARLLQNGSDANGQLRSVRSMIWKLLKK